eukprot:COSAG01_NODE_8881_length_2628_cov_1.566232_2_plen_73_part_01
MRLLNKLSQNEDSILCLMCHNGVGVLYYPQTHNRQPAPQPAPVGRGRSSYLAVYVYLAIHLATDEAAMTAARL